ncbi:ligase-associated DNA damage response endonuclease PdeM [Robiginitomaculum antarcticum]|uniref:ligase-associated DNA damage response endonuclease PdeM n=1 Tax=Robiginitomaculum antarcticum TaxID=437507 RepID=UPI000366ABAB|nr:ligase-associated DNA damage response endonuclease PdeM [Robiginitomaculum antarcticum]
MDKGRIFQTRAGEIVFDARKAAFLPRSKTLLVADLHFEKGSYLQMRGHAPLPAYDTQVTLARLFDLAADYRPDHIVALGDSFHDIEAGLRLSDLHREAINLLISGAGNFTWILGNHDPDIPSGLKGGREDHLDIDGFFLTHMPEPPDDTQVNICGHLHPKARVGTPRRAITHPCFACGAQRIIMPSFGAYTGGLYVTHDAINRELAAPKSYVLTDMKGLYHVKP